MLRARTTSTETDPSVTDATPPAPPTGPRAGWAVAEHDGRIVAADGRFAELAGAQDAASLVGRAWPALVTEEAAAARAEALAALAAGRPWRGALEVLAGAAPAVVEMAIYAAPGPEGGVVVLRAMEPARFPGGAAVDTRARVATLEAVAESPSVEAAARAVLQELQHAIAFDWAAVLRLDPDRAEVVATYPSPMAGLTSGRWWSPLSPVERALAEAGAPSLSGQLQAAEGDRSPLARLYAFGVRSALRAPLYAGRDVVGAVVLYALTPHAFSAEDGLRVEQLVRPLGRRLAELPGATPPPPERLVEPPPVAAPPAEAPLEPAAEPPPPPEELAPPPALEVAPPPPEEPPPPASEDAPPPVEEVPEAGAPATRAAADSERLAAIGEFVAGVTHVLNSPLTAIAGYAQMLPTLPEEDRGEALSTIEHEALKLGRIVRNLLYFARQQPPRRERVDLNALLRRIAEVRRDELAAERVTLDLRLEPVPALVVDEYQLEQVFLNLVSNAEEAMRTRGGQITVTSGADEQLARVVFADTGPGIPADVLPRVFDPFFSTREVGEGTGLGLSIAYGIVSEHGGRIWAESPPEGGARFVVELPLAPPEEREPAAAGTPQRRILVVDTDPPMRALLREILTDTGYAVDAADSTEAGLAAFAEAPADLLIAEVEAPDRGGVALYREIAARWPEATPRAVLVAGADDELPADLRAAEGLLFLMKPFGVETLLDAVHELLGA